MLVIICLHSFPTSFIRFKTSFDQIVILCVGDKTEIKIIVQPVDKFRFRYKSEMMGTHGSLLGEREESSHKKEVPTVQVISSFWFHFSES